MNKNVSPQIFGMNIELTTACPLRCPQCYCSLEGGKHIPLQIAVKYLQQAKCLGLKHVELSGGETLCYPFLSDLIQHASSLGIETNIAISGWNFTKSKLQELQKAGLTRIYVSLNGPTKEINSLSRDGYQHAITALKILKESGFSEVYINWVMHRNGADHLPEMILLAQEYNVKAIIIMAPKPTSKNELSTFPTSEQLYRTVQLIKQAPAGLLAVESCFSPLRALLGETRFLGNMNIGPFMGCGAGRTLLSISVDGRFSPCRHLEYYEKWNSVSEYWNESPILQHIREVENKKREPCCSCKFTSNCRHCLAINSKLNKDLYIGNEFCSLYK